ncbi:putative leader peptide [Streptomyces sp. NPDC007172]|uniref:putative leader peptide n=1 Tax=Streptomyces sp. NPDC007172 TaxID=3364776 RepID=UPI00367A5633
MSLEPLKRTRWPVRRPSARDRRGTRVHRAEGAVSQVGTPSRRPAAEPAPRRLHLYSRHHIDLLRVAGALCRP